MKAYIALTDGHGMALTTETKGSTEYYTGVDIYDSEGVEIEKCRFFPIGNYGSPNPVPVGLQAFFDRLFPATKTAWLKSKMQQWCTAAKIETTGTVALLYDRMLAWAEANNYPIGE